MISRLRSAEARPGDWDPRGADEIETVTQFGEYIDLKATFRVDQVVVTASDVTIDLSPDELYRSDYPYAIGPVRLIWSGLQTINLIGEQFVHARDSDLGFMGCRLDPESPPDVLEFEIELDFVDILLSCSSFDIAYPDAPVE